MLVMYQNALQLGGSIAASSQNPYWPAANIVSRQAVDVWRSAGVLTTETLTITLDRAYQSENVYLVLSGFDFTNVTAVTAALNGSGAPTVPLVGWTNGVTFYTLMVAPTAASTTLTLTFTINTTGNYVQMGKVYAGSGFTNDPYDNPDFAHYKRTYFTGENKDYSLGGQKFAEILYQQWRGTLIIPMIGDQRMADTIEPWLLAVGTTFPFFLVVDSYTNETSPSAELTNVRYVTLTTNPEKVGKVYGVENTVAGYFWELSLSLEQQL